MTTYHPLPEAHRLRLQEIIADAIRKRKGGKSFVARLFGCTRHTIKLAAAGQDVHPWTAKSVAETFAARDAEGKKP